MVKTLSKKIDILLLDKSKELFESVRKYKIISIATTSNINNPDIYFTSYRESENSITLTIIIKKSKYIKEIVAFFDGKIDYFLLDTESKSNIKKFLYKCEKFICNTKILYYKPNDITVDCVKNYFLKNRLKDKKVAIYGMGNIGTKLALTLCEISNEIFLYSKDINKVRKISDILNKISKSENKINAVKKNKKVDYLIGTSAGMPMISLDSIKKLSKDGTIIDVGNGCIEQKALEKALKNDINIICVNVIEEYNAFIEFMLLQDNSKSIKNKFMIGDYSFIKVGMIGKKDEIIVDNPTNIQKIYGICNGKGDLLYGNEIENRIKKIKEVIQNEKNK